MRINSIFFKTAYVRNPTKNKSKSDVEPTPIQELLDALSVFRQGEPSVSGNPSLGSKIVDKIKTGATI